MNEGFLPFRTVMATTCMLIEMQSLPHQAKTDYRCERFDGLRMRLKN